ncbi:unnamed protein product [Leptidea sinapis]|uniref:Uncharacterized protein n=1 Tax=Leptidea sinapis TaxID=189913 RepID=A0A5E4Q5T3_9NEOP|nr:unnamed protein product [Leptidea sinapis]
MSTHRCISPRTLK